MNATPRKVGSGRLAVLGLVLATGCELLTHPSDFAVGADEDAGAPFTGVCTACPADAGDLHHPPCPNGGGGDSTEQRVFAARYLHFGKPSEYRGPSSGSFHLGFDLDCSPRPEGTPVLCKPTTPDGGPTVPWEALPHGIDNSIMERIFGPLYDAAQAAGRDIDLDARFSMLDDQGTLGLIVTVDDWNGTPNDDHVVVSVQSSPGVSLDNGPPRWDGTDHWDLYTMGPDVEKYFAVTQADGYVSNGTLVVDVRSLGDVSVRFGSAFQSFRLVVHQVFFAGALSDKGIDGFTMSAIADVSTALESLPDVAAVLSACDPLAAAYLNANLPTLLVGAADMPSGPTVKPSDPCDSMSFAWSFDTFPAKLGGRRAAPTAPPDAGCTP